MIELGISDHFHAFSHVILSSRIVRSKQAVFLLFYNSLYTKSSRQKSHSLEGWVSHDSQLNMKDSFCPLLCTQELKAAPLIFKDMSFQWSQFKFEKRERKGGSGRVCGNRDWRRGKNVHFLLSITPANGVERTVSYFLIFQIIFIRWWLSETRQSASVLTLLLVAVWQLLFPGAYFILSSWNDLPGGNTPCT